MAQVKIDKNALVSAAKKKMRPERKNITFRLNTDLYDAFKKECDKQGVTQTVVLEEFFKVFTGKS